MQFAMDVDEVATVNGLEVGLQNGIHEQLSDTGREGVVTEKVNGNLSTESAGMNGDAENVGILDKNGTINASREEVEEGSQIHARINGLTISEVRVVPV